MPNSNEVYITQLEQDKADLIAKVENYVEEQKAAMILFKDQAKLISEKDQQLIAKDEELTEKAEKITKLKARIKVLSTQKKSNSYTTTLASDIETSDSEEEKAIAKVNISTQTEGITLTELEEKILEKRVTNLKDFGDYQAKLATKNQIITQLKHQLTLYQAQISKLKTVANPNKEQLTLLISLVVIITALLIFK